MFRKFGFVFVSRLACVLIAEPPAFGANWTVTSTADDSSPGTLRATINAAADGDTIGFNLPYPATITLVNGGLFIGKSLTLTGPGAGNLTISGSPLSGTSRVIAIGSGKVVGISGVSIVNGRDSGIANGGSTVTLTSVIVSGNSSPSRRGGIVNEVNATMRIIDSTVSGNSDGGIVNFGTMTILNTAVSGNSSSSIAGIANLGTMTVLNSTVSGNSSQFSSGAIANFSSSTATILNSTVSGNTSTTSNITNSGVLRLVHTTITGNSTTQAGFANMTNDGAITLKNSIVAKNTAPGGNCNGAVTAAGVNFSDDATCSGIPMTADVGLDPLGLQDNGGPTKTVALTATSPALNAVNDCTDTSGNSIAADQRGVSRPQGPLCDAGAYERTVSSVVMFTSLDAKLKISLGAGNGSIALNATFTLAPNASIDPLTQLVTFRVGSYQAAIPAGSFHQLRNGSKINSWVYSGGIGGATVAVQIVPPGSGRNEAFYQFKATASPVNTAGFTNPVPVTLKVGNQTGTVAVTAGF